VGKRAIAVRDVSKRFRIYHERPTSLKERLLRFRGSRAEEFWALRDVAFDVDEGQTLGLVGVNGSGKTTLLKIIGGILRPTAGEVETRGRIAALLELGAGFHPELTGRENVYLNASILGLSKRETDRHLDEIVGFAELEDFIDNQVKTYSSGMFVRLGFAVAVHVDPRILLVDEVLAVGDEAFQRKCIARVRQLQREGRTIVFVTHAMQLVHEICDRAVLLDRGRLQTEGEVEAVIRAFRSVMARRDAGAEDGTLSRDLEIIRVDLLDADGSPLSMLSPGDTLNVQVEVAARRPVDDPVVILGIYNARDEWVYGTATDLREISLGRLDDKRRITFLLGALPFPEGRYGVTITVMDGGRRTTLDHHGQRYQFEIMRYLGEGVRIPVDIRVERL
jgi:ABC-2 type transport system ATP-binding protein